MSNKEEHGSWQRLDDTDVDPCIDYEEREERLKARRLRIAAREEARRREASGEDPNVIEEEKEERRSHQQIDDSRQRLSKLVRDGTELVTNVQVAVDARETQRRAEENDLKRQRIEKLNNEAKASLETFEDITNKWVSAKDRKIPQEIWEILNLQQQQCAQLIEEKNKLISELQQELKAKDDHYVKDLKKQAEDIDLLIERMEEQIRSLTKIYREEILQIEKAFELERRELLAAHRDEWEKGMQSRRDKELEYLLTRVQRVEEYEEQLNHLRVQDAEEYSIIKIKLETDVQILEQQLQQMKATYQLNQEKLEYNFQVLKKRDDENIITKSQQKRKITRMQDVLNRVKMKLEKQVKQAREENQALTDDYKRIVDQYKLTQKKLRHFGSTDSSKFRDIWLMNEEEIKELVKKALEADRIINEQQLGLPWEPPNLWFMETVGPPSLRQRKKKSASELAAEVMLGEDKENCDEEDQEEEEVEEQDSRTKGYQFSVKTVKKILELISDESGFLIESKLLKLLAPLVKNEQSLMKLDAIFKALEIEDEDDVYKLVDFFLKYREQQAPTEQSEGIRKESVPETDESKCIKSTKPILSELIHPNDVVRALREFVKDYKMGSFKQSPKKQSEIDMRDCSADAAFWDAMANVIPESRLKEWDALEAAMLKYQNVLLARSQLLNNTASLGQQNCELRVLLHQYLNSKINSELEIPPSQVLRIDSCPI